MDGRKYGRTYHFPFSPGTTSDDKIQSDWESILEHELVLTEKLDGENTCLKTDGVYARSHVGPTQNPWARNMWPIWERLGHELGTLEVFGENLYGVHSIEYEHLEHYFYVFAIRDEGRWLSWEEVSFYAELMDLAVVPVLGRGRYSEAALRQIIDEQMEKGSSFGGECEGLVVRTVAGFEADQFRHHVLKYVRANHVKTDEHWTRNWRRAKLWYELLDGSGASESE
jgi:hypothetical protein